MNRNIREPGGPGGSREQGAETRGVEGAGGQNSHLPDDFGDLEQYVELSHIGSGAYATVYKAESRRTNEIVAMKKVRIALTEDGVPMTILREISLLRHLGRYNHPNIVRLVDICHGPRREREMALYLVFEHVFEDLDKYIKRIPEPGVPMEKVKDLMWQILCGVDFLHSHRIVHRDIKPQNILVARDGTVKIADFGLARIYDFNTLLTSTVVTQWYRAPEVLLVTSYATPVDLWSCGCILAEIITKQPLFPGNNDTDQLAKIFQYLGTPSQQEWPDKSPVLRRNFAFFPPRPLRDIMDQSNSDPEAEDLIEKILRFEPGRRLTAQTALAHPFFSECGPSPHDSSTSSSDTSRNTTSGVSDMSDSSINTSVTSEANSSTLENSV